MTKDVLIRIKGMQMSLENKSQEEIETIAPAQYYEKNGSHYVLFEDIQEGETETTKNILKFKDDYVELTKKGYINTQMVFETQKRNLSSYATPFGNLMIGLDTNKVDIKEDEDSIDLTVDYAMDINAEHLADCRIEIRLQTKDQPGVLMS